jgi:hypothetical protein
VGREDFDLAKQQLLIPVRQTLDHVCAANRWLWVISITRNAAVPVTGFL